MLGIKKQPVVRSAIGVGMRVDGDCVFEDGLQIDGAVLGPTAFALRFFGAAGDDRLLIVNLGAHIHLDPAPDDPARDGHITHSRPAAMRRSRSFSRAWPSWPLGLALSIA